MNLIQKLVGGVTEKATAAASDAAQAQWEQAKPYVFALAFMIVTTWVFFFLPRFVLPWRRAS